MTENPQPRPYDLFMLMLCAFALVALAASTFLRLDADTIAILDYADTGLCVFFFADFLYRLAAAENRLRYLKWGWLDLISSIPAIGVLRIGRLARIARILRILRGFRSLRALLGLVRRKRGEAAFTSVALTSVLLVVFSSIAILQVEKDQGGNIGSPEDALWWAWVTMTTVGYGDCFPVTLEGRVIAGVLMAAGVGLFGTFTAFVASSFALPRETENNSQIEQLRRDLAEIRALLIRKSG